MTDSKDEFTRHKEKRQARESNEAFASFMNSLEKKMHLKSEDVQPSDGFWYHRPSKNFPPKCIRYPSEYDGSDRLSIACTQTDLKPGEQKKLVKAWAEILPSLSKVKYLWFSSRVSQDLFDASAAMPNLEGLYIKWSGIKSIDLISAAHTLKYLHIGSSPSIAPLTPLSTMKQLEWLELENIRACADLSFISPLTNLRGLSIAGDSSSIKYLKAKSLDPLIPLQKLYWLSLGTFVTEDGSLAPIAKLRALKYLFLSNKYKMEEVAKLAGARPDIDCDTFNPVSEVKDYLTCSKCKQRQLVMPTGKGKAWMCVFCDSKRIDRHIQSFNKIADEYRRWTDKG